MSSDDPFDNLDNDRTVVRPMPGGRRRSGNTGGQSAPPDRAPQSSVSAPSISNREIPSSFLSENPELDPPEAVGRLLQTGLNPLIIRASGLLVLGARLRNSITQDRIAELKEQMVQQIRQFESQALGDGIDRETVLTARYLLCTYLDGAVISTPWGSESGWADQSLLSIFHNEVFGGEKFFQILDHHSQTPSRSIDLLELMFVCLALGFEGKFTLSSRGNQELVAIQESLYKLISQQRGEFERDLSPHWQGVQDRRNPLTRYIPLWVIAALLGVVLLTIYTGFRFVISSTTSAVYSDVEQIRAEQSIDTSQ